MSLRLCLPEQLVVYFNLDDRPKYNKLSRQKPRDYSILEMGNRAALKQCRFHCCRARHVKLTYRAIFYAYLPTEWIFQNFLG